MALWNKVSSGFDNEEETVNFGSRRIAENNGSLYETSTIATIQSDRKEIKRSDCAKSGVESNPEVLASVQHTRLCIAVDKSITVFEDETCDKVLLNISFGLSITCYCVSDDGAFLFVVLSNGVLYCLHLLTQGQVVFVRTITQNRDAVLKIFLQNESDDCIDVYLIATSGSIFRLSKFNARLVEAAISNDFTMVKKIKDQVLCEQLFKGFPYDEVKHATVGYVNEEISIAMLCSDKLFMWPSEQYYNFSGSCYSYTKIEFFRKYLAMLCLCSNRMLHMVCPQTLLGLQIYREPVSDFEIIENTDDNDNSSCRILVLARNDSTSILRVLSFPEFEQKFQINVPTITYLVKGMDPCDEIILFLEGVNDTDTYGECIDTIRIKSISESLPEHRLHRLLRREQFEAAETFARDYNLSMEPIYCRKASLLLSKLGPWAKKDSEPVKVNALLDIFDKIENVQYVVECCSKALVPEYKEMRKIHLYARARIMKDDKKVENDEQLHLLILINDTLHKLETFHMIWGYQRDCEHYDDNTMKEWTRFSRANFMEEYKRHLSLGEMEAATLIWTRHLPHIMKHMCIGTVKDIFAVLPDNISSSSLWPWLSHFVPTVLSFNPDAMRDIILWGCRKVKSFEQLHRTSWPQVGIDFANEFIKLLRFEESDQSSYLHHEHSDKDSNLKQLISVIQAMSDIRKLKTNYRLTISLDSYIGDPIEVSYMLLNKIHVDLVSEFVNNFLKQYMLNNSLEHDRVLSSYIQKTMAASKSWWSGEEAPWEGRVVVIINLIQDMETKLQQTLEVLKKASVPWSSTMITLAEENSNLDHVLASQIRTEYNSVPIKVILKKYGFERIGINDTLICRIIRENHNDMVSHIQQITKNDPVLRKYAFSSLTNHYLSRRNFEKVMEVLNSVETDVLLYCCAGIVNYVIARLTLKTIPAFLEYYVEMFGWVEAQLQEISKKCKTQSCFCNSVINNINVVKSRYLLRKEFEISVTFNEYYTEKIRILRTYVEQLFNADTEERNSLLFIYKKVIKLADLLQLQRTDAISSLLELTKNVDIIKYFSRSNEGQVYLMQDECKHIYKMCSLMLQYAKMDTEIPFTVKNLISSALCVCSDDELQSMLTLYSWAHLYQEYFNEDTKYGLNTLDAREEMPRTNWKLYTIYKESAIAVNEFLLPLFRNVISTQNFCRNSDAEPREPQESVQTYNQSSTEESLRKLLDEARKLDMEHNNYYLLQLMKTLYFNFCITSDINPTLIMETKSVYIHCVAVLLKRLMSTRTFDFQLGLSCLFMLPESEACKWISIASKSYQSDCTRHLKISVFGYEYFRLIKDQAFVETYKNNKMLHCWARKLSKHSIGYKEVLTSDATTKREILQRVMNNSSDDTMCLLRDFCSDFGFDIQDCLLLYLQTVIKTWNPQLNISNLNGRKELRIHEDEVSELNAKCNAIAAKVSEKVALKKCVASIYSQVNFYYYEVFIILMDLIEDKNIEHRNYFCFLQNYTRSGQPTKVEHDAWMDRSPECTSLPPIAKWRLPFLPKVELWTLITPELNIKTYDKWLDIAPILKLQPHIVCTLAIKGEVMSTWGNNSKQDEWSLYPKNSGLLNDIKKCIERMTGPNALYYGTAALYYVVNHTPAGADQVAAVKECYKHVQLSRVHEPANLETEILEKIKFKYLRFTSEHILHTHGLGNKSYLSLIGNPHKLVRELYTDESIPQRYRRVIDHRPDINSAVRSISELFSINVIKLQMELLHEWLQPDVKDMKFNESVTDTYFVTTNSESNSNSDDNLLRARYILEDGDHELSANFLINIGFNENKEDHSPEFCYRALQVLQSIVDTAKLEDLTKRDYQTIRNYMRSLKYMSRLESLGMNYSLSTFEKCSKHELVQILWKTQSYSPQAVVTIAQICIDFEIHDYSIWDKTLTQLAKLLMIHELKRVLLQVRNVSNIVNSCGYLSGWQAVISEPFKKMYTHPTSEQINDCIEALQLLYSCTVVHLLDFGDIIKYSLQCQQLHLAAALLPFLNDDDETRVLNTIKSTSDVTKVLKDLNNLSTSGILCTRYCNKIIQNTLETNIQ